MATLSLMRRSEITDLRAKLPVPMMLKIQETYNRLYDTDMKTEAEWQKCEDLFKSSCHSESLSVWNQLTFSFLSAPVRGYHANYNMVATQSKFNDCVLAYKSMQDRFIEELEKLSGEGTVSMGRKDFVCDDHACSLDHIKITIEVPIE